ncbi:MAG: oxidoreductase [Chloroflexi bacterium]|nr:MAG: oxidoreductase [Chloroflexota bacterium]
MTTHPKNFAAIGVAGYIAPRHLKAIQDTGNKLIAATDITDSVGILDRYTQDVRFFTEIERFDRHLEKLRHRSEEERVHYVSIMTPNYLHDAHCRLALRIGATAICEKPLVINPWNIDQLAHVEEEYEGKINTILQLRVHPALIALKKKLDADPSGKQHDVLLSYVTSRGPWYHVSWKGDYEKSGGVATNIGIHFFDMLQWLFGKPDAIKVYRNESTSMSGFIEFERAQVRWFLSVDENDLPVPIESGKPKTYRSITVDGDEIEFSGGFTDLHTVVYERTLAGQGFGLNDARPSIELAYKIRNTPLSAIDVLAHPFLKK